MKEPKMMFKIFATRERIFKNRFDPVTGDYTECIIKECFKQVAEKPTLKGAIGWRTKKQKVEGEYIIVPCF